MGRNLKMTDETQALILSCFKHVNAVSITRMLGLTYNEVYTVLKRNHLDVIAKNKHRQEPKKAYVRQFKSKNSQLY
jgi:hypothetical protein